MKGYPGLLLFLISFMCTCDNNEITSVQSESFIKYYALNRSTEGACVVEIPGRGYALLGNTTTDLRGSEVFLLLTDVFGNSVQEPKYYGNSKNDKGYCIKSAPGGGFVILGSTQDKDINDLDLEVWLIRTDDFGDTLWTRTFDQNLGQAFDRENKDEEGLWFDFNSKGDITMVGYAYNVEFSKQIWIYDVDQEGNQIDYHEPITRGGSSDVDEARFVKCIDGDNFLITGVSNLFDKPAACYSFMAYLKSDFTYDWPTESANYITEKDTSTLSDEANCLILVDNNTLLLCGSRVRTSGSSEAYLCRFNKIYDDENRFDPKKDTIMYYNNAAGSKATHMLMGSDNVYILSTVSSGTDKSSSTISVITTGLDGNNPAFMPIGGSSQMASRNFSFTVDGGLIIMGTNKNKDINDISSMVLIKTKAGGQL